MKHKSGPRGTTSDKSIKDIRRHRKSSASHDSSGMQTAGHSVNVTFPPDGALLVSKYLVGDNVIHTHFSEFAD